MLAEEGQWSFCVVIDWRQDTLKWLKARRSAIKQLGTQRTFDNLFDSDAELKSRGSGPAALHAAQSNASPPNGNSAGEEATAADGMSMRVFVDGSTVEVFTSSGQTASTRVYAAQQPRQLALVATGGSSAMHGSAWQLGSIWPAAQ